MTLRQLRISNAQLGNVNVCECRESSQPFLFIRDKAFVYLKLLRVQFRQLGDIMKE